MPSVFTLEGPRLGNVCSGFGCSARSRSPSLGENAIGRFILAQNPLVAIGLAFGLSAVLGLVLSGVAVGILEKAKGG